MYFIFDLDDTLLKNDKTISDYSISVLNRCKEAGHTIVINSARIFEQAYATASCIEPDYYVLNGGAEIYKGNECIYKVELSSSEVNAITSKVYAHPDVIGLTVQSDFAYTREQAYADYREDARFFDFSVPFPKSASKVIVGCKNPEFMEEVARENGLILTCYYGGEWYRFNKTTKAGGQKKLFELLGDANPVSVAFGDDIGDIEMLQAATIGVALKNSVPEVLSVVREVTEFTNDEDGCCRYIEEKYLK